MSIRATAILIFLLTLWSMAALTPPTEEDDQVITRLALVTSIVDMGSVEISRFNDLTGDKALFNGHIYPDKTPGHPLLAVPAVAIDKLIRQMLGLSTDVRDPYVFFDYDKWATITVNCLLSAAATALLFLLALRLGATRAGAVFAAFTLGLATPFFGWSTTFFAHSVTGSLLLIELAFKILGPRDGRRRHAVVDLTAAPAILVPVYALFRAFRTRGLSTTTMLFAGGRRRCSTAPCLQPARLRLALPSRLCGHELRRHAARPLRRFLADPAVLRGTACRPLSRLLPLSPVQPLVPFGLAAMVTIGSRTVSPLANVIVLAHRHRLSLDQLQLLLLERRLLDWPTPSRRHAAAGRPRTCLRLGQPCHFARLRRPPACSRPTKPG